MIVVMKEKASVSDIARVISKIESFGIQPHPSRGAHQTVIGVVGAAGSGLESELSTIEQLPGVDQIMPITKSFKLVSREFKPESTVVRVNGISVGGKDIVVMAGPCAVESQEQIVATARGVRKAGARVLRGGAFKPRTSPYSFQGHGENGLKMLLEAKRETGLAIVTEVISPDLVPLVAKYADILQVGARNMQNYALLEAVGRIRKPVLLKRGLMSTVEELLLAAEYVLSNGNGSVMLCERGIRTFEKATRNTLDISAIPVIKHSSHLPVVVDPSHATGHREYISATAKAAVAAGADAIIVEVHPSPDEALSDGSQSLTLPEFESLMKELAPVAQAVGRRLVLDG
jgi:3-deoxy-7-phosphoheptulonate synthase